MTMRNLLSFHDLDSAILLAMYGAMRTSRQFQHILQKPKGRKSKPWATYHDILILEIDAYGSNCVPVFFSVQPLPPVYPNQQKTKTMFKDWTEDQVQTHRRIHNKTMKLIPHIVEHFNNTKLNRSRMKKSVIDNTSVRLLESTPQENT
jgi:hypothetical protein